MTSYPVHYHVVHPAESTRLQACLVDEYPPFDFSERATLASAVSVV